MTIKRIFDHGFRPGMMALCLAAAVSAHAQSFTLDNGVISGLTGIEIQGSL
ncbi:hypothetical protein [Thiocapsa sp.]|uniref:hypothetical protein n=1 Tax=Thiocapsa sp. TaxID=2024551 RepID=UPI002D7FB315|nr:hypothetical protein [Thiocapsa sp.]